MPPPSCVWEPAPRPRVGRGARASVRGLRAVAGRASSSFAAGSTPSTGSRSSRSLGPPPLAGEDALRLLLKRDDVDWRFDEKLPLLKRGAAWRPFHPAAIIRNVVGADGDAFRARVGRAAPAAARLAAARELHRPRRARRWSPSWRRPRTLDELERRRASARRRGCAALRVPRGGSARSSVERDARSLTTAYVAARAGRRRRRRRGQARLPSAGARAPSRRASQRVAPKSCASSSAASPPCPPPIAASS